jgi:transketolase
VPAKPKSTTIQAVETAGAAEPGGRLDQLCINTIRTLAMDAVQQANSGHPGTPMALAPLVYALWQSFLRFDPDDPTWANRDRSVLSNGHASMLLYAVLHLSSVKKANAKREHDGELAVTLDDIKRFWQLGSKCPGHPEYRLTAGVETITGPLGQGCGNSVGMALAGRWLAQHFNRPGFAMFDYDVYAVCGDGDMMEGVSSEAASHQPIEQLTALRSIPGLITLRPADANEVVEAWRVIIGLKNQPACLVLTRQALPTFDRTRYAPAAGVCRGAYVLADVPDGRPAVILIGTGSEVALCIDAHEELRREGIAARVVSMPSWELFEQQTQAYRDSILPPDIKARVSVQMGSVIGWDRYAGATGTRLGMTSFGASAPLKILLAKFGFTAAQVIAAAKEQIANHKGNTSA